MIDHSKITPDVARSLIKLCPFGAITYDQNLLQITAGCKMCKICSTKGPVGAVTLVQDPANESVNKSLWRGVAVFVENHPVSLELVSKARELASVTGQPVYALVIGNQGIDLAEKMVRHGVDEVYLADHPELEHFRVEPYANVFEDFINLVKPSAILIGSTSLGRSLAPRVAARFRTGLTADCTALEMNINTDLVQIRPAFGGNIMAQIVTPRHRPQLCTVRYRIFSALPPLTNPTGRIQQMQIESARVTTSTKIIEVRHKPKLIDISEAEIIVAVGRGLKARTDLPLVQDLARRLTAQIACTRPLIEAGWFDPRSQIGLSGRTVKPRLIITIGISGSIQFAAGMNKSECIIAINQDIQSPIFDIAHYGFVGDLYEILPELNKRLGAYELQTN